jgi:signal transduction histidine kinase
MKPGPVARYEVSGQGEPEPDGLRLRRLARFLLRAEDEKGRRLSAELHDDALQVLSAAALEIGHLRRVASVEADTSRLEELEQAIQGASSRLRAMLAALRSPQLDREALRTALERWLQLRFDATTVKAKMIGDADLEPSLETKLVAFRIFEDALWNADAHSGASTVTVTLESEASGLLVRIADDGSGLPAEEGRFGAGSRGLRSMQERAELFGGRLSVRSVPGEGTTVEFWLPLNVEDALTRHVSWPPAVDPS